MRSRDTLAALLDLVLPRRCVACGAPGAELCEPCFGGLRLLQGHVCGRCGAPRPRAGEESCRECRTRQLAFASARAAAGYDEALRALVGAWKERGLRAALPLCSALVLDVVPRPAVDAVTWVPPDHDRALRRGHHPPAELAGVLGDLWGLPVLPLLVRRPGTRRQRGLARSDRQANVREAFRALPRTQAPPAVALVDDVYTTGATVSAAAAALRAAGSTRVEVVTLARAVR